MLHILISAIVLILLVVIVLAIARAQKSVAVAMAEDAAASPGPPRVKSALAGYFTGYGRMDRRQYWIGAVVVLAFYALTYLVPPTSPVALLLGVVGLVVFYVTICVYARRLHDLGLSGWLQLILYAVSVALFGYVMMQTLPQVMAIATQHTGDQPGVQAAIKTLPKPPGAGLLAGLDGALHVAFTVLLGLVPGQAGPNKYDWPAAQAVGSGDASA